MWTPALVEQLTQSFQAGLSARQIASQIGVTRNAVIGKISRLRLTRTHEPPRSRPLIATREPEPVALGRRALLDLGPRQCRWPIGDPTDDDFCFCGERVAGGSYCAQHTAIAYREREPHARHR
jgi:GcrA cell cycle regulator